MEQKQLTITQIEIIKIQGHAFSEHGSVITDFSGEFYLKSFCIFALGAEIAFS